MRPPVPVGPTALTAAYQTIYAAGEPTRVVSLILANPTAGAVLTFVAVTAAGAVVATADLIVPGQSIPAADTLSFFNSGAPVISLRAGQVLQAKGNLVNIALVVQPEV